MSEIDQKIECFILACKAECVRMAVLKNYKLKNEKDIHNESLAFISALAKNSKIDEDAALLLFAHYVEDCARYIMTLKANKN